ncbi:PatB family C-S lyase [Accumulibacter sp.]|uniref:MalY/PatB family protein n=2 Tax=Accumulibacter sp. TaxID=2053492 RepID=UPI0028792903|nr:PatB family C-S lyase [Accumulibacter sp.]MDS4054271.1 PatB family C-S lyase [Accumulibacter sp.]HMW65121.1 PatB family C-S lyase [Accumulibacter sp.]HMW81617.1 PatB family C-S lyase [Accumulibacter sp.]HNB69441.1 PatB family C-S lyase [Accumulibacter sp.]HNC28212.1 PatB family C-S lyase [Accumulibacter sp.]
MFDFDSIHDRQAWSSTKWVRYQDRDVIPLWIADMDFPVAPAIREALTAYAQHANFGYRSVPRDLPQLLVDDHRRRYGWAVDPRWIVWLPGLVLGLNLAVKACTAPGERVISFSPVYPPFLQAPALQGRQLVDVPLRPTNAAGTLHAIDFDLLEEAVRPAAGADGSVPPATRLLLLCHPHNPIGRVFTRDELERLAAFCERHDLLVCSDEVHCDLILDGQTAHHPFARVMAERSPELLARTITLHGPGKTYNVAGLGIAWAIIPDAMLRRRFRAAMQKLVPDPCACSYSALQAVFTSGESWRQALLAQLRANRDRVSAALERMGLAHSHPEVTYLTWIDARALAAEVGNAAAWFEQHGVGLSDGAEFGRPGYLRLNFAAPRALLDEALQRMENAIAAHRQAAPHASGEPA